jgi:hypothetical protein
LDEEMKRLRSGLDASKTGTVPRSLLEPFRKAFARPYKDLYRRLEALRDAYARL